MLSSPSTDSGHGVAIAAVPSRDTGAEDFVSLMRTQYEVDALCEKYGVPKEFTARPAGDRRTNSTPSPGDICVYARALEAGMRVPLHGFFREALAHFGIAPAQLTPNGWRFMAGFLVLCHSAGVPPSLAVFRRFFRLCNICYRHKNGWYFFRPRRDSSGLRFTGLPNPNAISLRDWKHEFFFLSSPELWPCAVEWGEPSKSSLTIPMLTGEENKLAAKLLRVHGGAAVDLKTYLCNSKLAAAMIATASPSRPPPPPTFTSTISSSKGLDPSVYDMMKVLLAEKAAAQASASAMKRTREEANGEEEVPPHSVLNTPLSRVCSPPPGSSQKRQHFPSSRQDVDTTDWNAASEMLQGAVAPPREPSDIVASSYAAIPQAANYVLELEEKLVAGERDAAALREQLEGAKKELASAKRAADAEREKARSELAAEGAELEKTKAELAAAERALEADVVKAKAELTAAKRAAEVEAAKTKAELAAARAEVVNTKAELAAAKRSEEAEAVKANAELTAAKRAAEVELVKAKAKLAAAEAELENAKAATVQQLLASEEQVRRRAEHALDGYDRWRGRHAPAGRAA